MTRRPGNLIRMQHVARSGHATISLHSLEKAPQLSWRACGLHAYLMTRPPGWSVYRADLIKRHSEGRDAIISAVRQLRDAGYVRYVNHPGQGVTWHVSWEPMTPDEWEAHLAEVDGVLETRTPGPGRTGNPDAGKPGPLPMSTSKEPPVGPPGGTSASDSSAKKKRKTSLPADFTPSDKHRQRAEDLGLDIDDQLEDFRLHAAATGRLMVDWGASFTTWLKKAQQFRGHGPRERRGGGSAFDQTDAHLEAERIAEEERQALEAERGPARSREEVQAEWEKLREAGQVPSVG